MNKIAHYLQEHLSGEVVTETEALAYFSTDASVLTVAPNMIVYPRNEQDIRKTARFTWQLAERGRVVPITARGAGTDQSGAAIGAGIIMVFPAHLNRVLEFDTKAGVVTVEPGIIFAKLQQALHTHNRFIPAYPASIEYSTVGGAVGKNTAGEKAVKYGSIRKYVKSLRVVLANGEVIDTGRLSKRELSKKLGLATMEGEIYRNLDTLIEENWDAVQTIKPAVAKNAAGYALDEIKHKDGSFDLTPLLVGSQGTLGLVSEIVLTTEPHVSSTTLIAAFFDDLQVAEQALSDITKMSEKPSSIEAVNDQLLTLVKNDHPNVLKGIVEEPFAKLTLLIEFDNPSERNQKHLAKKVEKLLTKYQVKYRTETDEAKQDELWMIRELAGLITAHSNNGAKAVPIIEDGVVPLDRFNEYLLGVYDLFQRLNLEAPGWGHAGEGNLRFQPFLNLSQIGDRQKLFKMMDEYYELVLSLGGSVSGSHGDGRIRAPFTAKQFSPEVYALFQKVKQIFDPYGTLNPGVKLNVDVEGIKPLLRDSYSLSHLMYHLPRN